MTISSVAPATLPTGTTDPTSAAPAGVGVLFAGLLSAKPSPAARVAPEATTPVPTDDPDADADCGTELLAGIAEILAAAQVMAAAQVVPVTPVLAAAVALESRDAVPPAAVPEDAVKVQGTLSALPADLADVPAGPTPVLPTGSTAVSASDPVPPAVPPSDVPPAAPPRTEQVPHRAGEPASAPEVAQVSPVVESGPTTGTTQHQDARRDHGTATALSNAPATRQEAASTTHITGQVFPGVSRLMSRGDGTRRITLKLSPEALGDVRVVLTVRDGDVQVRMVGSEQAQQALRAGAPELQRLLDLAGAASSQIIVGDQGSAPDAGLHGGTDRHAGDQPEDHRTAGTRDGDTSARDGSSGGPQQRPSTDPDATRGDFTRTRSGVDVTM